jgi:uncharacterized protein
MIERDGALRALQEAGCSEKVVQHCLTVERAALSIANRILANGRGMDLQLVSVGALLHDIGRSKTHGIGHGVEGGKILRRMGLSDLALFAEHHMGAGIPAEEAKELGLPAQDYMPTTLEEKVVAYADKLVIGDRVGEDGEAFNLFKVDLGPEHPAVERLVRLHEEIQSLMKS